MSRLAGGYARLPWRGCLAEAASDAWLRREAAQVM
jgi:hypothetical protein